MQLLPHFPRKQTEGSRSIHIICQSLHFTFLVKPVLEHGVPTSQATPHLVGGTGLGIRIPSSSSSSDTNVLCDLGHKLLTVPYFPHL